MIHETPAGRVVTLGLSRDGQPVTIKVQLADRRKEFHHMESIERGFSFRDSADPNFPDSQPAGLRRSEYWSGVVHSSMRSGLMVENLTPQLGEFFGAKNGNGVLVRSVEKGSRADKAGLRAGDVIVRVGDQPIHDTSDFTHALHSRSAGSVNVGVIRDKKEQTLTITLPERKDSGEMIEESFEAPELDAETQTELSEVQNEIAKLRPADGTGPGREPQGLRGNAEICVRAAEADERTSRKAEEGSSSPRFGKNYRRAARSCSEQMEQLRQQMQGDWLDI